MAAAVTASVFVGFIVGFYVSRYFFLFKSLTVGLNAVQDSDRR
jgi:hypothetical protein